VRVCVVGSGAREHALTHVLSRSAEVVCVPGNPGIEALAVCTDGPPESVDADLYVVGPEAPLVDGLADRLRAQGRRVFGPGRDGARLEGSKAWMKAVLASAGVPTAAHATFGAQDGEAAEAFLRTLPGLYVVKTDGLAAGKGVLVTTDLREAIDDVRSKLSGSAFGDAGRTVVIEEGLTGAELSVLALVDGTRAVALAPAQDFKRIGDGDTGPNTGGMGAYSPVPGAGSELVDAVMDGAVAPTLAELRRRGVDYRGVLYAGIMLTPVGPKVLEFNVRFGDPEAEVVLPRIDDDLAELLFSAADGRLLDQPPAFRAGACVVVILASAGYPAHPRSGDPIEGVEAAVELAGVDVYHAGTARDAGGRLVTAGGRVLAVTGHGANLSEARRAAYAGAGKISWAGRQCRTDIAQAASGLPMSSESLTSPVSGAVASEGAGESELASASGGERE
jgi:phosphoribosylamine---glycine ligase